MALLTQLYAYSNNLLERRVDSNGNHADKGDVSQCREGVIEEWDNIDR